MCTWCQHASISHTSLTAYIAHKHTSYHGQPTHNRVCSSSSFSLSTEQCSCNSTGWPLVQHATHCLQPSTTLALLTCCGSSRDCCWHQWRASITATSGFPSDREVNLDLLGACADSWGVVTCWANHSCLIPCQIYCRCLSSHCCDSCVYHCVMQSQPLPASSAEALPVPHRLTIA
jgi:hypothetical protein